MKRQFSLITDFYHRPGGQSFAGTIFIFLFLIMSFFPACGRKMSLEEAKQVTVSMREETFVPPPRRIDDILASLEAQKKFGYEVGAKIRSRADVLPPDTDNRIVLAKFYKDRSRRAWVLGRYAQSLEDSRQALTYAGEENGHRVSGISLRDYAELLELLALSEFTNGNFRNGINYIKRNLDIRPSPIKYRHLARSYITVGDANAAEKATQAGLHFYDQKIGKSAKSWPIDEKYHLLAQLLQAKGQFAEAESHIRAMIDHSYDGYRARRYKSPRKYLKGKEMLARNLTKQGRLIEAELVTRETLKEAIGYAGKDSGITADLLGSLKVIMLKQRRRKDAEKLAHAQIRIYQSMGMSDDSAKMAKARAFLGRIYVTRGDFGAARAQFDMVRKSLRENRYYYETVFAHNPYLILSLLKTGRLEEAIRLASAAYEKKTKSFGKDNFRTARFLGLRGMAYAMMNADRQALKDLSVAVPILIDKSRGHFGTVLKIIIEAYIDLLDKIKGSQLENEFNIKAVSASFRFVNAIFDSDVQEAIWAIGARAIATDSDLEDLVRREQDAVNQLDALQEALSNILAAPADQQNASAIKDLRNKLNVLDEAHAVIRKEIDSRFPKYSNLMDPRPVTMESAQALLNPGEALISIYPGNTHTFIWAFAPEGPVHFASVSLSKRRLKQLVLHLRQALDSSPGNLGEIPEFDLGLAHDFYNKLLKPVENGWKEATDLLVIAPGSLGLLPFSLIPTEPFSLGREKQELFSNYRKAPWLIRKVSITRLPSVSAFVYLRTIPEGDRNRKAFAGFGDPFFNQGQLAQTTKKKADQKFSLASTEGRVHVRGVRITKTGNLDSEKITTSHMDLLNRLPDTAEEIKSIARATGADIEQDIFLGIHASEHQVKTMNLSDRRIVAFATHALLAGDLDGLDQPALVLCSPSVSGDNEDGLLTMGEIMKLRMNADWVVLSACNTGAADGAGAEAVSGLGRAFFYAGSRALLVSMWPVETTSARKLTTGLFRHQVVDKKVSRARALRKSILDLIDGPGLKDPVSGEVIASYAHPLFWAPFIIVGDSGLVLN